MKDLKRKLIRVMAGWHVPYPYRHYNDRHRCIFIHIPKTAGTSILQALGAPETGRQHIEYFHYQNGDRQRFERYFKFAVVRNPIDRIVSSYNYYVKDGNGMEEDRFIGNFIRQRSTSCVEFITNVLLLTGARQWNVFRPQCIFICDRLNRVLVDYVARFESLAADCDHLRTRLPAMAAQLPVVNVSRQTAGAEVVDITDEAIATLRMLYPDDFALFYPDVVESR